MTATAQPWSNDRGTILSQEGQVIAECHVYDQATNKLGGAERDDNADLIVRACNKYGQMRATLIRLVDDFDGAGCDRCGTVSTQAINNARRDLEMELLYEGDDE